MGRGRSGEFGLGQLTSLAMGSPLTARSQSDPGVICTKTLTTAILPSPCLFLLKISPHPTSEPKGRLLLLLKKTFTDFLRKSKRQSEYRLVQRQSLTVITTDAESDLLTVAQFAQFVQLCLCSFGTTRTFAHWPTSRINCKVREMCGVCDLPSFHHAPFLSG